VPQASRAITDPHTSQPLEQHPLLCAQRLDHNFALTLCPPEHRRGTMGRELAAAIQRLVDIKLELVELGADR
jgi:hypothetical protein